jgi:hypothetical protein
MGQGLYKPWIAATAGETLWTHALPFVHKRVGLSAVLPSDSKLDAILALHWVEKLLREAKVLGKVSTVADAGVELDGRGEVPAGRMRIMLGARN